jgi:hypothetical protein
MSGMNGDPVVGLLTGIWNEIKESNLRLGRLDDRVGGLEVRVEEGFARMDRRFDAFLLGTHGQEHADFRDRLARVEAHARRGRKR